MWVQSALWQVGEFLEACDEAKSDPNVSSDWDDVTLSVCEPRESTPVGSKLRNWIDAATENTDVLVIGAGALHRLATSTPNPFEEIDK